MSLQDEKGKSNKRPNYNIKIIIIIIKGKESEKKKINLNHLGAHLKLTKHCN